MNVVTEIKPLHVFGWRGNPKARKTGAIIYKSLEELEYVYAVKEHVYVDGKRFENDSYAKRIEYECSEIFMSDHEVMWPMLYRGQFYLIIGYRSHTQDEVCQCCNSLNKIFKDIDIAYHDVHLGDCGSKGFISMHYGYSYELRRKISLKDVMITHKELLNAKDKFTAYLHSCEWISKKRKEWIIEDVSQEVRRFVCCISNYLMITEKAYAKGKFDMKQQMVKRLHLRIYEKSKQKNY